MPEALKRATIASSVAFAVAPTLRRFAADHTGCGRRRRGQWPLPQVIKSKEARKSPRLGTIRDEGEERKARTGADMAAARGCHARAASRRLAFCDYSLILGARSEYQAARENSKLNLER
jgi:hypothetical protein